MQLAVNVGPDQHEHSSRFIANSSSYTTTELSKLLTTRLTAIKKHVIKYCDKVFERSGRNLFWSIKNSNEILNKLKSRQFRAFSLSTYDFSPLYTTLPHNPIKGKLNDLIEWTFRNEDSLYLVCNVRNAFFTSEVHKNYTLWICQKVCEALTFLLDNIDIRLSYFDKLRVFRWVRIAHPLWLICSCFVMKETS